MAVLLGVIIVVVLVNAVLPVPVTHHVMAWIGVHLGSAINSVGAKAMLAITHGHDPQLSVLISAVVAVLGLGFAVIMLAILSTACAALRAALVLVTIGALLVSGAYATTGAARLTFWAGAAVAGLLFVGVVVFGRLVAVIATIVVGASALAALLDIHGSVTRRSAQTVATLSHLHNPLLWSYVLTGLGVLELVVAARILISGRVHLSPPHPGGE